VRTWPNGMRHQPSKLATRVRLPPSAPGAASSMAERQALNLCRSGFKSLVAHHAGVKGIGIPRELRPRGLRVRLAPSAPDGHWGNMADPPGPGPGVSWFEARMASFAAAHGCGPAPVRRVTRVGTGWRLHGLVAQQAEAPGRGPDPAYRASFRDTASDEPPLNVMAVRVATVLTEDRLVGQCHEAPGSERTGCGGGNVESQSTAGHIETTIIASGRSQAEQFQCFFNRGALSCRPSNSVIVAKNA
jgi:hypothetical protein